MVRKRTWLTGCSKGLGLAMLQQLLRDPEMEVWGFSRSRPEVEHARFHWREANLAAAGSTFTVPDEACTDKSQEGNPLQGVYLINNAGWIGEIRHVGQLSPAGITALFQLNTTAPLVLMNQFIALYGQREDLDRVILNISSGAARKAIDGWSAYSASKAALNRYSETVALEAAHRGSALRCFSVAPGVVDTDMQADIRRAPAEEFRNLEKFTHLKSSGQLWTPERSAAKCLEVLYHPDAFSETLVDVRAENWPIPSKQSQK
ncbi:MAG: SDR family NAD(P)-dependent oxidoreductase [Nitritalea sp.]